MSMEQELGTLIFRLNPYTDGGRTMRFTKAGNGVSAQSASQAGTLDLSSIEMEVQSSNNSNGSNYETQWAFKGQSHNVVRAIRIKYHYPVKGSNGTILATDYLLVGFEGTGGP
jgi:hypothetical protein